MRRAFCLLLVGIACLAPASATGVEHDCPLGVVTNDATVTLTFEGVAHRTTINGAGGYLYPCTLVRFNDNWVGLTDQRAYSDNPSGVAVATWLTGDGELTLDSPVSDISLHYASFEGVRLEAYDAASNLIATDDADSTDSFRRWSTISVSVDDNAITRVRIVGRARAVVVDDLAYTVELAVEVPVDVKPGNGNEVDPLNLASKGNVPVAVLTTDDVDATMIVESSVHLGDPLLTETAGPRRSIVEDVDGDGRPDRVFHFRTQDLVDGDALAESTTELELTGRTDTTPIFGYDSVRVISGAA